MNKYLVVIFFITSSFNVVYSQNIVEMRKINGIYQIPCKVNGIPMNFVFDTGASDVTISVTEAKFLLKQGLLKKNDFLENVNYTMANGEIIDGTKINLKTIEIGGNILTNISASIIYKQNVPLLLGQSALSKLGEYSINGNYLTLNSNQKNKSIDTVSKSQDFKEMINYINQFLSINSWWGNTVADFEYNVYSNSLNYKSIKSIKKSMDSDKDYTIYEENFSFNIADVISINEMIRFGNEAKSEPNILTFRINLNNEINYFKYTHSKNDEGKIPDVGNTKRKSIDFTFAKSLTNQDSKSLSLTMRDIFKNATFETKYF